MFYYLTLQVFFALLALCVTYVFLLSLFKKEVNPKVVRELVLVGAASSVAAAYFGLTYFYTHTTPPTAQILFGQHPLVSQLIHFAPQIIFLSVIFSTLLVLFCARLTPLSFIVPNPVTPPMANIEHRRLLIGITVVAVLCYAYLSVALIFL